VLTEHTKDPYVKPFEGLWIFKKAEDERKEAIRIEETRLAI
jgi:hypothetical protein